MAIPITRRSFLGVSLAAAALTGCSGARRKMGGFEGATDVRADSPLRPSQGQGAARGLFLDATRQAGIDYVQGHGSKRPLTILETIGSGCAFLDFDGDGWLDILLVGQPRCALYRNRRDGTFEDVTRKMGLDGVGHWLGCAVGDFDGDGFPDLYISGYDCGALYQNRHGSGFQDVTAQWGIKPRGWETACAFFDATGSGNPDLYVGRYVEFNLSSPQFCEVFGVQTACHPDHYPAQKGSLYLNTGRTFREHSLPGESGKCLGAAAAAYYGDARPALALANDGVPGNLFRNRGGGRWEDVALATGTAFDVRGLPQAGMGEDWGDYDNDGSLDLVVNTFSTQPISIYHSDGGRFIASPMETGLGPPTTPYVKFGVRFFDYDNDGFLDLVSASGHVETGLESINPADTFQQPLQLFHNRGNGAFELVSPETAGEPFRRRYVGRGLAVGDYDRDGRLDLLVIDSEGAAMLLQNQSPPDHHWISIDLLGVTAPRNGEGAIIRLTAGDKRLMRNVSTSGSYLSANPSRVHFGLGAALEARNVVVEWPWGSKQRVGTLAANHFWKIRQGQLPVLSEPPSGRA